MGNINVGRVILGGFVAGIVINVFEFVLNGVIFADQWPGVMAAINRPALAMHDVIIFNVLGFIEGIAAVWTYAAIRQRFGVGVRTAIYAGALTWITAYVLATATPVIMGVFPHGMAFVLVAVGLVEIVAATIAGAWLYKEA